MGGPPGTLVVGNGHQSHWKEPTHATAHLAYPRPPPTRPLRSPGPHSHRGRLPTGGLLLAQAPPRPGRHHLSVLAPDPPRQHRLLARRPVRPLDLLRQRLLPGPQATAAARFPPAARGDHRGGAPEHRLGPPLVRPPRLGPGRLELLDARHAGVAGRLRPARQSEARLRLPGGHVAGAVRSATGMLLRCPTAPLRSHEMSPCAAISEGVEPGDIVMGDRGLSSYAHLAILVVRNLHGLF